MKNASTMAMSLQYIYYDFQITSNLMIYKLCVTSYELMIIAVVVINKIK